MEECYFIDEYGAFKIKKFEQLDVAYTNLECVLKGKLDVSEMYYPYIMASNPDKYLKKIKLAIKAEKEGIRYILVSDKSSKGIEENHIILYKKKENREKAILFKYLLHKYAKMQEEDFNPIDYILNNLNGYDKDYNRRYFMARYINRIIPQIMPKQTEKIMENPNMTVKEKYMAKYQLAKKYDGFVMFNKKYKTIEQEAHKIYEKIIDSKAFKDYLKKTETHLFKFTIKDSVKENPLFERIESAVKRYAKSLGIKKLTDN